MKKYLLLILICNITIVAYSSAATVTWDGGAGTSNWTDAMNWDTDALPTAADVADLDGNTVVLSANTTVQRVYAGGSSDLTINMGVTLTVTGFAGGDDGLEVQGSATVNNNGTIMISNISGSAADGLYVKGMFTNSATGVISISNTGEYGIYTQGGTFINEGTITITDFGLFNSDRDGICADDNSGTPATFNNNGSITIIMTGADDGIYVNDGSVFNNASMVTISGTGGDNGIRVDDASTFNNNVGGTFTINSTPDDQLFLDNDGAFVNMGTVNLNNGSDVGLYVTDDAVFTNIMNGIVNITSPSNYSIQLDGNLGDGFGAAEVINNGTMTLSNGSNDGLRMQENGTMTNNATGVLNINSASDEGIQLDNPSTLNNSGTINITGSGNGVSPGDNGIELAGGTINNSSMIVITNIFDKGILLNSGLLSNSGTIDISNTGEEGMDMVGGTFNNLAMGTYQAGNCTDDGLEVNVAILNNDGAMKIFGSGSDDIETFAGFTFNNTGTATFAPGNSPGELELKGSLDLGTSTTTFEITGTTHTTQYDRIENFTGSDLTVTNATAHLDWGTYIPNIGDCYDVIVGGGNVVGTFASITTSNFDVVTSETYSGTGLEICVIDLLPVELVYFTGEKTDRGIQLSWMTATEINNEGFDIERSNNGEDWTRIGYVQGNGNSAELIEYDFLDENPSNTNYYRLKQNDFDGKFEYSNIIIIDFEGEKKKLAIYPIPVQNELNIQNATGDISIFNSLGQVVYTKNSNENQNLQLDMSEFINGTYYIIVNDRSGESNTLKFVKY